MADYAADVDVLPTHSRPNPPMTQYAPRQVKTLLSTPESLLSDSTLRRWSEVFSRHLSPSATTAPRRYTDKDVAILRRVKTLSNSGMRITEIDAMLDQSEPLPPTEPPTEPAEPTTTALTTFTALLDTLAAQQATQAAMATTLASLADVAALRTEIAELRERVARIEGQQHGHPGIVPTRRRL